MVKDQCYSHQKSMTNLRQYMGMLHNIAQTKSMCMIGTMLFCCRAVSEYNFKNAKISEKLICCFLNSYTTLSHKREKVYSL